MATRAQQVARDRSIAAKRARELGVPGEPDKIAEREAALTEAPVHDPELEARRSQGRANNLAADAAEERDFDPDAKPQTIEDEAAVAAAELERAPLG